MAPGSITSKYKAYKASNSKLTDWLEDTVDRITVVKPESKGGPEKSSAGSPVSNLISQAHIIATAKSIVQVPQNVLQSLNDAITGRIECQDWCKRNDTADIHGGHRHYIYVLQTVRNMLEPSAPEKRHQAGHSATQTAVPLSNIFAHLDVEQPSDEPFGQAHHQPFITRTKIPDVDTSVADEQFAVWCLLGELDDIRQFVSDSWRQYTMGELSLAVVAPLADTGVCLLRRTQDDFNANYPQLVLQEEFARYLGAGPHINIEQATSFRSLLCHDARKLLSAVRDHAQILHRIPA